MEDAQESLFSDGDASAFQEVPLLMSTLVDLLAAATGRERLFCAVSSNEQPRGACGRSSRVRWEAGSRKEGGVVGKPWGLAGTVLATY